VQFEVTQLSTDFGRLVGEVSALRSAAAGIQTLSQEVSALKAQITATSSNQPPVPSENQPPPPPSPRLSPRRPHAPSLDSRIISGFAEIFAEFRKKQFALLWRGSCDGFSASKFHGRCDGHGNTLTVILDTKGNVFGGFTPAKWESANPYKYKGDDSVKSFVFTLKNPHNISARKFALKEEKKQLAIRCKSERGPCFGGDIAVADNCNAGTSNATSLGHTYLNDTGMDGKIVFTGSGSFKVEEIEIFEIID
jgi:hypothetical protein